VATLRGGDRFEKALAQISAMLRTSPTVARVGFLENAKYPDGTPVAAIALIQDMGAPGAGIPPRPFFRNMIADKQGEWPAAIAGLLRANDYDAQRALGIAGAAIAGQLRQSIIDTNSPALAQSTIDRKGFAKPLVDTGHMLQSVDFEVVAK
jgi:hypothetical protein